MINKELSKEEMEYLLFNTKVIGRGFYGMVVELDDKTVFKIYYKDIINTLVHRNINNLDYDVSENIRIENKKIQAGKKEKTNTETMIDKINQLDKTKAASTIKGVGTYKGYLIGIFMENYKDYNKLEDIYLKLDKNNRDLVLLKVRETLSDLFKHGIIPLDIKDDNILVREIDLDVKLIDLDGVETRFKTEEYIKNNPDLKSVVVNGYKRMENSLTGRTIDFDMEDI